MAYPACVPTSGATSSRVLCKPVPPMHTIATMVPSGEGAGWPQSWAGVVSSTGLRCGGLCSAISENTLPLPIAYREYITLPFDIGTGLTSPPVYALESLSCLFASSPVSDPDQTLKSTAKVPDFGWS